MILCYTFFPVSISEILQKLSLAYGPCIKATVKFERFRLLSFIFRGINLLSRVIYGQRMFFL